MNWGATAIAFVAPCIGFIVPYLALQRSKDNDRMLAQSGAAVESRAESALVIDGLNKLLDQTQEDKAEVREQLRTCVTGARELAVDRDAWRDKCYRYERLHGPLP